MFDVQFFVLVHAVICPLQRHARACDPARLRLLHLAEILLVILPMRERVNTYLSCTKIM